MGRQVDLRVWRRYAEDRMGGANRQEAATRHGIAYNTAAKFDRGEQSSTGYSVWTTCAHAYPFTVEHAKYTQGRGENPAAANTRTVQTTEVVCHNPKAREALADFSMFRQRYFGEVSLPWHVEVSDKIDELQQQPGQSFAVFNAPPGAGKSALIRAIGIRATVRNRKLRGARLSNSSNLAVREVRLMRRHLERTTPVLQKAQLIQLGLACDALSTLAEDYGRFKPEGRDQWSSEAFVVLQPNGLLVSEKEPTWSAYGMDSVLLGNRLDLILADDVDTPRSVRANESTREAFYFDWNNEVETRLEPDGLLAAVGQRLSVRDIYRYCADKGISTEDVEVINIAEGGKQYHHFVYPAHFEDICVGEHSKLAKAWPEGCLLDPYRVPWSKLVMLQANQPHTYHTVYQQRDGDPDSGLIDPAWIDGGRGRDGLDYVGCWDKTRSLWQIPEGVSGGVGCIQVDPSGTQHWAVQAWLYVPPKPLRTGELDGPTAETLGHQRILLDIFDGPMQAPDLLDWNHDSGEWHGKLEEWRQNFAEIGRRLDVVVVEVNAAQRYLLQFEHAKRWAQRHFVRFLPHSTGVMKTDARMGVMAMRGAYQFGLVRLPAGDQASRRAVHPLVEQVKRWPDTQREDQVMAEWFGEFNLSTIAPAPTRLGTLKPFRPSWLVAS